MWNKGIAYNWFRSFLEKRLQCAKVNGIVSGIGEIRGGVPQGPV